MKLIVKFFNEFWVNKVQKSITNIAIVLFLIKFLLLGLLANRKSRFYSYDFYRKDQEAKFQYTCWVYFDILRE